ncbi:hypothetical protein BH09MYX1_BH09MYX1_35980 [soil metagenome]
MVEAHAEYSAEHFVWARAGWAMVDLSERRGLALEPLFAGLPFDEKSLRRRHRISWDHYCTLVERIDVAVGGGRNGIELLESYHHHVDEELGALGSFVSPKAIYRFIAEVTTPIIVPPIQASIHDLAKDRIRIELRLLAGARPSETWFRLCQGVLRGLPCCLGLPLARVAAETSATHGSYVVDLPPSRTLAQRAVNAPRTIVKSLGWMVLGIDEGGSEVGVGFRPPASSNDDRLATARATFALTVRQHQVLELLVQGKTNEEIASALGCAEGTAEFHVSALLRKANAASRAELIGIVLAPD